MALQLRRDDQGWYVSKNGIRVSAYRSTQQGAANDRDKLLDRERN